MKKEAKKVSKENICNIVSLIEENQLTSSEIITMFDITKYILYKIMDDYNIKPKVFKRGPKKPTGPKKTQFGLLLRGTEEEQKEAKILPECFVIDDFITDSKNGMKILELMPKYNLTLYQIRELRKKYELTRK